LLLNEQDSVQGN